MRETVFRAMSVHVHELDPNRPVHYEGVTHNRKYDDVTDIESRMYAHADEIEEYLKSDPKKPYISCEYMHAMGNSCGNMDEYTALERYPKYQAASSGLHRPGDLRHPARWNHEPSLWRRLRRQAERLRVLRQRPGVCGP